MRSPVPKAGHRTAAVSQAAPTLTEKPSRALERVELFPAGAFNPGPRAPHDARSGMLPCSEVPRSDTQQRSWTIRPQPPGCTRTAWLLATLNSVASGFTTAEACAGLGTIVFRTRGMRTLVTFVTSRSHAPLRPFSSAKAFVCHGSCGDSESESPPKRSSVARVSRHLQPAGTIGSNHEITPEHPAPVLLRGAPVETDKHLSMYPPRRGRLRGSPCRSIHETVRDTATLSVRLIRPNVPGRSPHNGNVINVVRFRQCGLSP